MGAALGQMELPAGQSRDVCGYKKRVNKQIFAPCPDVLSSETEHFEVG